MFQDAFIKLDRLETEGLLEAANPKLDGTVFHPDKTVALVHDLPFYQGYRFAEIADHESTPPRSRFIVQKDADITVLDWTNGPIYLLNEKVPIRLDHHNVIDYVRFFFSYIRGRHGRFLVTETVDDIRWQEEPPPAARKAVGKMLLPLRVTGQEDSGDYLLESTMVFKDSLFRAKIRVKENGRVELFDEELVLEDIPVLDDMTGQ